MVNDERMVQELPEKSQVEIGDQFIIEDEDGTKLGSIKSLKKLLATNIFFNTVEDMKTAILSEGEIVRTLGYHSVNDGGAGIYIITYAPEAVNDDALIHYLHTSDTLRAMLITNDNYLTPEVCGAYGDGIHNDADKINYIIEKGRNVKFIPSHKYLISSPIKLKSNMKLDFSGSTIIPNMCNMIEGLYDKDTCSILENIVIENFNVDLNTGMYAVRATAPVKNLTIRNFSISNNKLYAIRLACGTVNIYNFQCNGKEDSPGNVLLGLEDTLPADPDYISIPTDCTIRDGDVNNVYPMVYGPTVDNSRVTICRCKYNASKSNQFANIFRPSAASGCIYNIYDITGQCNEAIIASEDGKYVINNIFVDCTYLIRNTVTNTVIVLGGYIDIVEGTVLQSLAGELYINTPSINAHAVTTNTYTNYTGKVRDGIYPGEIYVQYYPINESIKLTDVRNMNIDINGSIRQIVGGIEGQVIKIKSTNGYTIYNTDLLVLKSANIVLDKYSPVTLVYNNRRWVQV